MGWCFRLFAALTLLINSYCAQEPLHHGIMLGAEGTYRTNVAAQLNENFFISPSQTLKRSFQCASLAAHDNVTLRPEGKPNLSNLPLHPPCRSLEVLSNYESMQRAPRKAWDAQSRDRGLAAMCRRTIKASSKNSNAPITVHPGLTGPTLQVLSLSESRQLVANTTATTVATGRRRH